METTIREILKNKDLPSKEIKQRFNNKQIKLNNVVVTDLDLPIRVYTETIIDLGDFVYNNIDDLKLFKFIDIKDFFGNFDTNIDKVKFLGHYQLISISKKDHYVLLSKPPRKENYEQIRSIGTNKR